jgi:hypothetical protein
MRERPERSIKPGRSEAAPVDSTRGVGHAPNGHLAGSVKWRISRVAARLQSRATVRRHF